MLVAGSEVARDRWTLLPQFTFLEAVDPKLMIVNPIGLLITSCRTGQSQRSARRW